MASVFEDSSPESSESDSPSSGSVSASVSDGVAPSKAAKKDCWNTCDYPSECRWGRRFGIHTPVMPAMPPPLLPVAPQPKEGILKMENVKDESAKKSDKGDFWGALLASATRRKSSQSSSPLALEPVVEEPEPEDKGVTKDNDGDVIMGSESTSISGTAASTVAATLTALTPVKVKDIIRKTSRRGLKRRGLEREREDLVSRTSPEPAPPSLTDPTFQHHEYTFIEDETDPPLPPLERVKSRDSGYCSSINNES